MERKIEMRKLEKFVKKAFVEIALAQLNNCAKTNKGVD